MRRAPQHSSEMVSELLWGEPFEVIDSKESWKKIKGTIDGYEGWIEYKGKLHPVNSTMNQVYIPDNQLTTNEIAKLYPGSILYPNEDFFPSRSKSFKIDLSLLDLLMEKYKGVPYYWGGKTTKGIDCSGLAQVIYRCLGVILPRDASQQAEIGEAIDFDKRRKGDLAFFKNSEGKVIHIGICLENGQLFHASENVRIDTLDKKGIFRIEIDSYTHINPFIRRVIL